MSSQIKYKRHVAKDGTISFKNEAKPKDSSYKFCRLDGVKLQNKAKQHFER